MRFEQKGGFQVRLEARGETAVKALDNAVLASREAKLEHKRGDHDVWVLGAAREEPRFVLYIDDLSPDPKDARQPKHQQIAENIPQAIELWQIAIIGASTAVGVSTFVRNLVGTLKDIQDMGAKVDVFSRIEGKTTSVEFEKMQEMLDRFERLQNRYYEPRDTR